jgi:peptide/nickel transport system substrate-binding protein
MKKHRKWLTKSLFFILALMIISACSAKESTNDATNNSTNDSSQKEERQEVSGGTLDFAFNAQPPTLDPTKTTATATRDITRNIFEQLVTFDSNFQVKPMLAESYEVNEEENTITFKLREGVKFHNGKEMKAEDVIASMEKWAKQASQPKAFLKGITFKADGDYTVIAQLEDIGYIDLFIFADITQIAAIMPKEAVESATENGLTEYIGTGPYKFVEWKQDQYIHLEKFDEYQARSEESNGFAGKKSASVDEIFLHFVTDPSTRVAGLQTGEYDIANFIPYDSAEMLEADPNVENNIHEASFGGLVFNKKQGLFTDIKMRQAVAAALNLEDMMYAAYGDEKFFGLGHALVRKEQTAWYTDAGKEQYDQRDLDKARKLLKEAGYNGEEIRILTSREYDDYYTFAVVAQQQLKEIGMNIKLEVYDWATLLEKRADPSAYEIFTTGWAIRPTPIQYPFMSSKSEWPGWTASDKIDSLMAQIQQAGSQEEALELTAELQEEFWNYLPIVKPGNSVEIISHSSGLSGYDYLVGPILWNISINE